MAYSLPLWCPWQTDIVMTLSPWPLALVLWRGWEPWLEEGETQCMLAVKAAAVMPRDGIPTGGQVVTTCWYPPAGLYFSLSSLQCPFLEGFWPCVLLYDPLNLIQAHWVGVKTKLWASLKPSSFISNLNIKMVFVCVCVCFSHVSFLLSVTTSSQPLFNKWPLTDENCDPWH